MVENTETLPSIVIDNGSGYCKAGFSGEEGPRTVFPTLIGRAKSQLIGDDFFVGLKALEKMSILNLTYPIEHGLVNDWNDMEKILDYLFTTELKVDPSDHNVMITESSINTNPKKEKMAQILFETFNVPGLYFSKTAPLSLYSVGKFTGLSVESGDSITQFVPIFDGYELSSSIIMYLGGRDINDYLIKILNEVGVSLTTTAEREIAKDIKVKTCYVALDFEMEKSYYSDMSYEMPDGVEIKIKDQRFRAPEILFHPEMCGKEVVSLNLNSFSEEKPDGIDKKCYDSIEKSNIEFNIKRDLYKNIILTGGSTCFSGLPERLTKEVKYLVPKTIKNDVTVIAVPERKYSIWIGGSLLSSLSTFKNMWITKEEYNENGASIIHKKK